MYYNGSRALKLAFLENFMKIGRQRAEQQAI